MPTLKPLGKPRQPKRPAAPRKADQIGLSRPLEVRGPYRTGGKVTKQRPLAIPGVKPAAFDASGLPVDGKFAALGPHNRANAMLAIEDGMVYAGQSGTTEEMCVYGELKRRGFTYGLGTSPRSYEWQYPLAGSILDFVVWDRGSRVALRPMNVYWHGHLDKIPSDRRKADQLLASGQCDVVFDLWSGDSLDDQGIVYKMSQYFGEQGSLSG